MNQQLRISSVTLLDKLSAKAKKAKQRRKQSHPLTDHVNETFPHRNKPLLRIEPGWLLVVVVVLVLVNDEHCKYHAGGFDPLLTSPTLYI